MALTAEQAAKRLGRTERTVRRWVQEGKLQAFHPVIGRKDKVLIEESEVERLAQELAKFELPATAEQVPEATAEQNIAGLVERLAQLEQEVRDTRERLTRLETLLSDRARMATEPLERVAAEQRHRTDIPRATVTTETLEPPVAEQKQKHRGTHSPRATGTIETPEDIPSGSILIGKFAEVHGVNPRTFRDQITKGVRGDTIDTISRPKPGRESRGETERWLSPDQQQQAIDFWKRHGTHFEQCDNPECACRS